MKNYYTAKEARQRLGIEEGKFFYLVKTKRIKRITPPGKNQGVYPKTEVDRLAREMLTFLTYDESQGIQFMKAKTQEDIQEEYNLASMMFGHAVHDIATRKAWLSKNPDIDFIIRDHGNLVAFINVLPVEHETIMQFMRGEIRGWEIPATYVLPYTPNSQVECILMGMATTPEAEPTRRSHYGRRLINGLFYFLEELAEQNIIITKFYGTSSTPTGIAIMRNAGFNETGKIGKRVTFELDTMTSDTWTAREYRAILEAVKNQMPSRFKIEHKVT
ncbi:MAG: hypothetical protein JO202_08990 [Ktedonobacteraceae bacterium]|nr:hypothetical protein [Ktedonobacteraceae bacterium]